MRARGARLVAKALEDEGVRWTFGIPGTHNTELYDALQDSKVRPMLVTDEQCASFMADGLARSGGPIGVANVVPGAGVTHALSGVAEAYMDGVPMLVLTCGIRTDTGRAYQLHDVDQLAILKPITKGAFHPGSIEEIYPTLRRAIRLARSGTPGPVAVEIAANLYLLSGDAPEPSFEEPAPEPRKPAERELQAAAELLNAAERPGLYLGFGAKGADAAALAERLGSPVATTFTGKGVFPESHPLWAWNGFGAMAPAFAREAIAGCDAMLAIGCRFGQVATANYLLEPPKALIHVDINPEVFDKNYKAALAIESDAAAFVEGLLPRLKKRDTAPSRRLAEGHARLRRDRLAKPSKGRVTPAVLFDVLQRLAKPDAIFTTDSGNGTFLAIEHLRLEAPGRFLAPVDYSCMGYSVPAAIGAKLAHPATDVVALAGDGALLMTGLELMSAAADGIAPIVVVLRDKELAQIAQFQRALLNRDTCSILAPYEVEKLAAAVNCEFVAIRTDAEVEKNLQTALDKGRGGRPVLVDCAIDYSFKTFFTKAITKSLFTDLPAGDALRTVGRALTRKLTGGRL